MGSPGSDLKGFGLSSVVTGADLQWKGPGELGSVCGGGLRFLALTFLPGLSWQSNGNGEGARLLDGLCRPWRPNADIVQLTYGCSSGTARTPGRSSLMAPGLLFAVLPTPWHCWQSWLSLTQK